MRILKKLWPFLIILTVVVIFFYPYFLKNLVPMPADLIVGAYYPWLDYKWVGYNAGVPIKNPLLSDVPSVIYPQRLLVIEQIKNGILPLWNPLMFSGYPLLATFQSSVFYPLNILYFLFPFIDAWSIQVIFQPVLASIFTYLFLRNLGLTKIASILGGFAYALGGFNLYWLEYNVHAHTAAYIPLLLYLVDKYILGRKLIFLILLSIFLTIQIFAGYLQLTFYTLILLFFWTIFRIKILPLSKRKIFDLFIIFSFLLLGIFLSGVQIIPGFELLNNSQRVLEILKPEKRFLEFSQLVTLVAPDYFGNSATYNYWGPGDFTNSTSFTGMVAFTLAVLSLPLLKLRGEVKFFWAVLVTCLILSVRNPLSHFIVINFMDHLLSGFRASSMTRLLVLINLSLATLAAFGFDYFLSKSNARVILRLLYVPTIILTSVFLGTLLSFLNLRNDLNLLSANPESTQIIYKSLSNYTIAMRNLVIPITLFILTSIILVIGARVKKLKILGRFLILILLIGELIKFGWKITPFSQKAFVFPKTPIFEWLEVQPKPFRVSTGNTIPSNMWMPYNIEAPDGYDAVYPLSQAKFISISNNTSPVIETLTRYGRIEKFDSHLLNLVNSEYFLSHKIDEKGVFSERGKASYPFDGAKFTTVFEDKSVAILKNTQSLPRAFFVSDWEIEPNETQLFEKLLNKNFPLSKKVLLNEEFNQFKQSQESHSEVNYLKYDSLESQIQVSSSSDGLLFISDTWYPGWKAKVDGKLVEILKANHTFRAIPLSKGSHKVKMYYDPESFKIGLMLSFLAVIILGVTLINGVLIKKNARS